MPPSEHYRPAPRIHALGEGFYDEVVPARFPRHVLRYRNQRAAATVGLGDLSHDEWTAHFAGFEPLPRNLPRPLALRYHGHQFDVYNPYLGDGRGFLFAQLEDATGRLLDLGTKGSGATPWSRGGDGRLTLKGGVREVLATEMLEALGVPTSRSLSLYETGEQLVRGDEPSPTRSSVLVRLSHSHIRFGTFQRLAHVGDVESLERLVRYVVANYFPELTSASDQREALLSRVSQATAAMCARVMIAGFVHGVLNSDNMAITGECFDYGPYRFLPTYDPTFVAAYFDHGGLYAYGQQPRAMLRNVLRLAEALRPIAHSVALSNIASEFEATFEREAAHHLAVRLGLQPDGDLDAELLARTWAFMQQSSIGYERFFFDLYGGLGRGTRAMPGDTHGPFQGTAWTALRDVLALYRPAASDLARYFEGETPCTLLIGEIESIWTAIAERDDWGLFDAKIERIRDAGAAVAPLAGPVERVGAVAR
jgi:uncharacterized protein YdiU (UPF0061 family)